MIVYKELSSLSFDLGFSPKALYAASNHAVSHYRTRKIPKSNGETRTLNVPDGFMKAVQRSIAEKLLAYEYVSKYAFAYKSGTSTVSNAKPHLGNSTVLKMDIRHFFDSITYPMVKEKVFKADKYSEANRILLSLLCVYKDNIPQGAPTSPAISNIIMSEFDDRLGAWCSDRGITYTRYCDDMTFSGDFDTDEVKAHVTKELEKTGFFVNCKKTVTVHNGQRKNVTGIVVNDKLNVPSSYRKNIRKDIYYCRKFGVESHLKCIGADTDKNGYLHSLLGRINYVLSIDGKNSEMKEYKSFVISQINENSTP